MTAPALMMITCPCCRRPYPSAAELIAERVDELRHACELHEIEIIDECYVDERAAAKLLGFDNHRSLANRRFIDQPLRSGRSAAASNTGLTISRPSRSRMKVHCDADLLAAHSRRTFTARFDRMSYTIPRSPQQKAVNMAEVMRRLMLAKEINFAGDDATPAGLYMKAAVEAASTGNTAALVDHPLVADFRDSMQAYGYFERLRASPASLKLPLQVAVAFTIASGSGALVEEMAPKPLSIEQDFDLAALDPLKAVALFVMTRELARMSQIATALISQNGRKSVALQTDVIALSVLTALAPSISATGTDAEAFLRDLASLASLIPTGVDSQLIAAVDPEQLKRLALMPDASGQLAFPDLDATKGGSVGGVLIVPTSAITSDSSGSQIVLTDAAQVCIGDGAIDVRNATSAVLQFDSEPTTPPDSNTVMRNLFQENKVATMIERWFGIKKLRANSVAVLDGVNYVSVAS